VSQRGTYTIFLFPFTELKNMFNSNYQYFVGPTCIDGRFIHLQLYSDETCSTKAENDVYVGSTGTALPYSFGTGTPLVLYNDCLSCIKQIDKNDKNNNNGNNGYYDYVAAELCQRSVEAAAKCEANMESEFAEVSGCEFIHAVLPRIESLSTPTNVTTIVHSPTDESNTMEILAWTFGSTTILLSIAFIFVVSRRRLVTEEVSVAECGAVEPASEAKLQVKD
jgi:hypothetical protein